MKRIFALLAMAFLLSGCAWFKKNAERDPVAAGSTEFGAVMTQMHQTFVDDLMAAFPTTNIPLKNETAMTFNGELNLQENNKATFLVTANGKSDYSDAGNPRGETTINISGEMNSSQGEGQEDTATANQTGKGMIEIAMKLVNKKFMASLQKAEASQNGQDLPLAFVVGPYLGKWYGATFEEVNTLLNQASGGEGGVDISASFQKNPNDLLKDMKERLRPALEQVHFWKLEKTLPEENGMLRYRVSFDKEAFQQGLFALAEFAMTNPDGTVRTEQLEQAKADIEASMQEEMNITGTLSVSRENVRDFTFEGTSTEPDMTTDIMMKREGERFEFNAANSAEETDETESGNIEEIRFVMERTGEKEYDITLTVPRDNVELMINDLKYTDTSLSFDITVKDEDNLQFSGNLDYEAKETDSVTVEEPQTVEPLQNLLSGFLGGMMGGAMGGVPEVPENVPAQ